MKNGILLPGLLLLSCSVGGMPQDAAPSMPAGTIIAYGGPKAPEGWLLCDGRAVSRDQYPDLFKALGSSWGGGGDGDGPLFNLPDLRGRFLRGADEGAGRDPDREGREAVQPGGNTGNLVGSLQKDATRMPRNPFVVERANSHPGHGVAIGVNGLIGGDMMKKPLASDLDGAHEHKLSGGDAETRPENVSVNWLVKF